MTADALVTTGLADLGYVFVNIGILPNSYMLVYPSWLGSFRLSKFHLSQITAGRLKNEIRRSIWMLLNLCHGSFQHVVLRINNTSCWCTHHHYTKNKNWKMLYLLVYQQNVFSASHLNVVAFALDLKATLYYHFIFGH